MIVPRSEDGGAFRAKYSKDATGWAEWKSGIVAGKISEQNAEFKREVYLSRYAAPIEIVSNEDVAKAYKEYTDGTDVFVPWNVVSPDLRKELVKAGVSVSYGDVTAGNKTIKFEEEFPYEEYSDRDSSGRTLTKEQQEYFKDSKVRDEEGNLIVVYHGTDAEFTVFDRTKGRSNADIQGMFFSPWDIDAGGYGKNVGGYYLNIKNPASESTGYKALRMFQGQNNAGVKAREYLISKDTMALITVTRNTLPSIPNR